MEEIKSWNDVFAVISLQEAQKAVNDFNLFQLRFFPVQHQIPAYGVQFSVGDQPLLMQYISFSAGAHMNFSIKILFRFPLQLMKIHLWKEVRQY